MDTSQSPHIVLDNSIMGDYHSHTGKNSRAEGTIRKKPLRNEEDKSERKKTTAGKRWWKRCTRRGNIEPKSCKTWRRVMTASRKAQIKGMSLWRYMTCINTKDTIKSRWRGREGNIQTADSTDRSMKPRSRNSTIEARMRYLAEDSLRLHLGNSVWCVSHEGREKILWRRLRAKMDSTVERVLC